MSKTLSRWRVMMPFLIFLFLGVQNLLASTEPRLWDRRTVERRKKTAEELGVPECKSNFDCVVGGVCIKDRAGKGRCFCSSSCPLNVPVQCIENNQYSCASMGEPYTSKYDMRNPLCYHKRCICPPQFDPQLVLPPAPGFKTRLPMKCDKRELQIAIAATPSESVYKGTVAYLFCCVNIDPRGFITEDGVTFIQNGTRRREPTGTPYESFSHDADTLFSVPTCWILGINNVQLSDSGTYQCLVQPANGRYRVVNATMEFVVKMPRKIQNVTITPTTNSALIAWDTQTGPELEIEMELFKRSDRKMRTDAKKNAKSPVVFEQLSPATPYTLFINVTDGQNDPIQLTEHFQTSDGLPDPPILEDIRLVNMGHDQMCEVEWRPPTNPRGHILRYYVQISGQTRRTFGGDKMLSNEHFPQGSEICSNNELDANRFVNPNDFQSFFACKYGPLKPNRNYSATVWAENRAGRSKAAAFSGQCLVDFAEPDYIEPPEIKSRTNMSSFGLRFGPEPSHENGPIACYYLAILPLPANVSVDVLPSPELIIMDTVDKALQNNLHQSAISNNRFFAYIAESYMQYPREVTMIGDGDTSGGMEPCNVLYLTRYKPTDSALSPDLMYTGFLIARVDRDPFLLTVNMESPPASPIRSSRRVKQGEPSFGFGSVEGGRQRRWRKQLANMDPAYGFSDYFKPVLLKPNEGMDSLEIFFICLFLLLFLTLTATIVLFYLHKRGLIKQFCPVKKGTHDLLRPGIPPAPIKADDLPAEYILKHRDSDYQFAQEFEMLPRGKNLDHTISERKENARRNRYNDIKACDATRVRLRRIPGDPNSSDYINANFIKAYKGKKTFIATQGPLECTVGDFWRMIWEQGSRMIIMVANLRERGREQCVKYWPDEDEPPLVFRTLEVSPVDTAYFADYTVRTFELSDVEPPPLSGKSSERVQSAADRNSVSGGHGSPPPPPLDDPLGRTPSPPPNFPLIPSSKSHPMNSSAYSIHSRSSLGHDFLHSSTSLQRNKHDSEYANISSVIRPQSKCSGRISMTTEGREKRRVVQYHFTSWNDYKAPECTIALLRLLCKLRKMDDFNYAPVVVHCSAGVGRTGTLVAIDYVMDQVIDIGTADVFSCVAEMRQQRNLMVQSVEQYVFIYKALAEYQLFGDTDLTISGFRRHVARLRQPLQNPKDRSMSLCGTATPIRSSSLHLNEDQRVGCPPPPSWRDREGVGAALRARLRLIREGNNIAAGAAPVQNGASKGQKPKTQLELEFQDLSITLEKPKSTEWAHKEENVVRNRFVEAVPFNANRVVLQPLIGYDNSYINASFIKGYFYPYILAQDPLGPETAFDFWRMINDQQTYTIVMLSTEQDFQPNEMYWPREVSKRLVFGKNNELTITLAEEVVQTGFVQRKLHYRFKQSDKGASSGRDVLQFSFLQWKSGSPTPNSCSALLDLIGRVLERQSNIPDAGPIVLHCRDGSAENGIFCSVSLLLERLRSENMIDVFRTVKALQLQRPLLFTKIEQYAFCYDCAVEYLNQTCK